MFNLIFFQRMDQEHPNLAYISIVGQKNPLIFVTVSSHLIETGSSNHNL